MKKFFSVLTIVLGMSAAALAQTGTTPQAPTEPKSAVKFEQLVYNFGEVPYNSDVSHSFKFTNVSGAPVAIKDVGTSCGCTTPGYSKEPVAPGKTGSVTAKYDSSRIGGFNKTLTVFVNDEQIRLTITGTIKEPKSDNSAPTQNK
jgi:opacity protein-like surface antigen